MHKLSKLMNKYSGTSIIWTPLDMGVWIRVRITKINTVSLWHKRNLIIFMFYNYIHN